MSESQADIFVSGRRRIVSNFGWLIADRVGRMVVNVVVGVVVARHLGPDEFGVLSFSLALTGMFTVVAGFGLEGVVVRDLVRDSTGAVWKAAWQLRLGLAMLAYGATVGAALVWRPDSPRTVLITAIVGVGLFFTPADLIDAWFQAIGRVRRPAVARQIVLWIAAAWRLALVAMHAPLTAFAAASAAEAAAIAFALWLAFRGERIRTSDTHLAAERRRLLREGWPLMMSGLLVTITLQIDRLLIAYFKGDEALGIYAVAARLTESFHMLPLALGAAIMPRLTSLRGENEARYWVIARWCTAGLAVVGLAAASVITWMGPWLIAALFGAHYADAAPVLVVHAWTLAFVFVVSLRSRLLVIEGATRWVLAMSLLTAALNVAGNLLFVPRFGSVGAAWAAVVAWAFAALIAPWFFGPSRSVVAKLMGLSPGARKVGDHA